MTEGRIKDGLLLVAKTETTCVPPSPSEMPVRLTDGGAVVFSVIDGDAVIGPSVGAWLTGVTVTVKVC